MRDISWRLNNKHQFLLCAPTRDVFSLLPAHQHPSTIGTSSIQITLLCHLPAQLSLRLLNVPCCLGDNYLLSEIQKQFRSLKSLHLIRTSSQLLTIRLSFVTILSLKMNVINVRMQNYYQSRIFV